MAPSSEMLGDSQTPRPVVLIAAAEGLLRWTLQEVLMEAGFDVRAFATLVAAETAGHGPTAAALVDASAVAMRSSLTTLPASCPIIALIADDTPLDKAGLMRTGAREVMITPIDVDEVLTLVRACVGWPARSHP